jgi:general secretion pathway protein D
MKHYSLATGFFCLGIMVSCGQAWAADAPPADGAGAKAAARPSGPDVVTLNFVNADIEGVVKAVSEITGKNFVLDPRVKGTVNIVSAKPMSRALVYQVFLSALRLQGFAAVEERGMVMIVPEIDAKMHRSPTLGPQDQARAGGQIIQTQVFKLQHESAAQLVAVLRPLISPNNSIVAYPGNNTLVVTDYASNLERIEKIIESVDLPTEGDSVIIALQHASAVDVAQTITRLLAEPVQAGDSTSRFTIAADARSNSVLARTGDPARLRRVRELAAMLDSPTSAGGNIHVIYLKNAQAVKLAEVLRAIYTGESVAGQPSASAPVSALGQGQAPAQSSASSRPGIIQADAATNSIIITAPDAIYNNLRAAVEKLDVRRAQVYVEALIAEVTASKAAELGVQWQDLSAAGKSTAQVIGGTNFGNASQNILGISQNPTAAGQGLNIGLVKGTVTVGGAQILNLGLLVRALESDANANILSTPTLLTLDNEEAKIVIGQNVPFITGSYAVSAAATTPTPFQTIERKDVGLTLKIKPQISEGGAVRLQISQEVSSVDSTGVSGIITNKRSVDSTVLVDDGQIVVIGGLIQDTVNDGVAKVPGLGDLPLIGGLFKYNTRSRSKTNLMVFLRPTLLRSAERADSLSSDRYDYILGEQLKAKPAPSALPDFGSPSLPPRQGSPTADKPAAKQ